MYDSIWTRTTRTHILVPREQGKTNEIQNQKDVINMDEAICISRENVFESLENNLKGSAIQVAGFLGQYFYLRPL